LTPTRQAAIALAWKTADAPLLDRIADLERAGTLEQGRRATQAHLAKRIADFRQNVGARLEEITFSPRQQLVRLVLEKSSSPPTDVSSSLQNSPLRDGVQQTALR
jgi:hypothetical protein